MNTPTRKPGADGTEVTPHHPYYEEETTSISPGDRATRSPFPFRNGKTLVLQSRTEMASHLCLKSGRPTKKELTLTLRSPWNPLTWFAASEQLRIGLSRESLENHRLTRAIAWTFILAGIAVIGSGVLFGIPSLLAGTALGWGGFMIRAAFPIRYSRGQENVLLIRGCGEKYLQHYPAGNKDITG